MKKYQRNQTIANIFLCVGIILFIVAFMVVARFDKTIGGMNTMLTSGAGLILFLTSEAIRPETIWSIAEILKEPVLQGKEFKLISFEPFDGGYLTKLGFDKNSHSVKIYSETPLEKLDVVSIV